MKVIAIDPGVTTGIAYGLHIDGLLTVHAEQSKFTHAQLFDLLYDKSPNIIVCESFEFRQKARSGLVLYSCELIGVIKLYVDTVPIPVELVMQTASKGKGYYSDHLLNKNGVYVRGVPHGMDALRHLLHWYTFGSGYKYNKKGFQ
jgi:hypothetical protein